MTDLELPPNAISVPLLDALGLGNVDQGSQDRWNAAAQEVLERQIEDDRLREEDAQWERTNQLRSYALQQANAILGER